jgi:MFS family permease
MISGLSFGHALFHWFGQSLVVVLPEIQSAFGLTGVGVGSILTVRGLASGIVSLPGGVLVDMCRRYWGLVLSLALGVLGVGVLMVGLSPAYPILLIGIAVVAMTHSIWHLPVSAALSYHFPARRAMALSFHGVGGSIGDVVGPVATGALLAILSWREVLSLYAVLPLMAAAVGFWAFKGIGGSTETASQVAKPGFQKERLKQLLKHSTLWALTVVQGLRGMALVGLLTFLPLYLGNHLGLSVFSRGFHIGLLIAIGLVAKPTMGYVSDRLGRKTILVTGMIWSCALCLLLITFNQGIALTIGIVLLGLFLYPDQPILTAAVMDIVDHEVASTALGILRFASFILSAVSPIIAASLYETHGVNVPLYYVAALFAASAIILVVLRLAPTDQPSLQG